MKSRREQKERGVALVVTMIVMAVMAVVAVAFMQGASSERAAANSLVGNYQALLAAEAASECAVGKIGQLLCRGTTEDDPTAYGYHDTATVWQNIGGNTSNEATVLYIRANANDPSQGARPGAQNVTFLAAPLVSGAGVIPLAGLRNALPFDPEKMVNLNATNELNPEPWIGYRSAPSEGAPVLAASWIYISRNGGETNATNPPIARYAYWIEDESFKLNVNVATNGQRGTDVGRGPQELTIDGTLGASPRLRGYVGNTDRMLSDRERIGSSGFSGVGMAALGLGLEGATNLAEFRFLTTTHSAGLNLSRGGFKRFNVNSVVNEPDVRRALDRIIVAITNSNSSPNFGQRFYRLATNADAINSVTAVSNNHASIYLNKIAANIVDYIDEDSQPTVINNSSGFSIRAGRPTEVIPPAGGGLDGPNQVAAYGVENIPYLYGYGAHARLKSMKPVGFNTNSPPPAGERRANFEFTVDHYLELWNMGTRPIEFGSGNEAGVDYIPDAFVKIANAPGWGTSAGSGDPELAGFKRGDRDHETEIPSGVRILPGASVLFTTASAEEAKKVAPAATQIVSLAWPDDMRDFRGETKYVYSATNASAGFNRLYAVRRAHSTRQGNVLDAETEILIGNNLGVLQSFPYATVNTRNLMVTNDIVVDSDKFFIDRSRLRGNRPGRNSNAPTPYDPRSQEGDPRTLNEQLEILSYQVGSGADQSRFFTDANNEIIGRPNTDWVQSAVWVDPSSMIAGAANAPLIIANQAMQSIGELGHLVDGARPIAAAPVGPLYARGGGRTLRVGQPEHSHWYDGSQTSLSRTWTSWRLADVFSVSDAVKVSGLINPNGVLRDGGAALRAALYDMKMLPSPDGSTNTANRPVTVNNVVDAVLARMSNSTASVTGMPPGALNPFWERGEISELALFNTNSTLAGADMQKAFDRGREEVVRRSIEMITTRGSVFTVYAMGQALQVTSRATNVIGTSRIKVTFELVPQFADVPNDAFWNEFNPANASAVAARFREPTNYTRRIIAVSYD